MKTYSIALIPGDGIGNEVVRAAVDVLQAAERGFTLSFQPFDWGCEYYLRTGRMMDADGLDRLRPFDAILLGAIGLGAIGVDPLGSDKTQATVPDHVSLRDLLLRIRFGFDLYVNLRPIQILPGLEPPLRGKSADDIRMVFVRENTEGEYCGLGGRFKRGTPDEVAIQQSVFTRKGVERVLRYAFELARRRPRRRLASATKSNAMQFTMVLWDDVLRELSKEYPDVSVSNYHVDALAARMITHPETLDVVVASNLFADILTDLGGALQGSLGLAASANLNPAASADPALRLGPPIFEPVHGSAPDIAGRGIANPIAAIWASALMMEHLGEASASRRIMGALEAVTGEGRVRTPDLGGHSTTAEFAAAVIENLPASASKPA
ncbi:MAG TPA: tartrate dehydrogenase [Terriglobia bacterium]|nr:tartrate dehydrogenase [Terriglobia bacterium]